MLGGREKVGKAVDVAVPVNQKNRRLTFQFGPEIQGIDGRDTIHEHFIREIPIAVGALGCALWDGGLVLARFLYKNGEQIIQTQQHHVKQVASEAAGAAATSSQEKDSKTKPGPRILDLGCGVGLGGIMAAHFTDNEVVLTDYIPDALANALFNVGINEINPDDVPDEMIDMRPAYNFSIAPRISVEYLDWDAELLRHQIESADRAGEEEEKEKKKQLLKPEPELPRGVASFSAKNRTPGCFDLIIGAELTYNLISIDSLAFVIDKWLSPDGAFIECLSNDRDGVSLFVQKIESLGFVTQRVDMGQEFVGNFGTRKWSKQELESYSMYSWRRKQSVDKKKVSDKNDAE